MYQNSILQLHFNGILLVGLLLGIISTLPVWNQTSIEGYSPLVIFVKAIPQLIPFLKNETVRLLASYRIPILVSTSSHLQPQPNTVPLYYPYASILTSFSDQTSQQIELGESLQNVDAKQIINNNYLLRFSGLYFYLSTIPINRCDFPPKIALISTLNSMQLLKISRGLEQNTIPC